MSFWSAKTGIAGLVKTYDLKFAEAPRVMDLGLLYRALENRSVDIVAGSNTDGLIAALGLVVLEDDRHYFPPYDAVLIVRPEVFQRCPAARSALESHLWTHHRRRHATDELPGRWAKERCQGSRPRVPEPHLISKISADLSIVAAQTRSKLITHTSTPARPVNSQCVT